MTWYITAPGSGGLLEGTVAVITGAGVADGIGTTCAAVFVKEGAKVLAADISGGQDATAAAPGPSVEAIRAESHVRSTSRP